MTNGGFMKYLFFLFLCISLSAQEFQVDKSKSNSVKFISNAPIENFEGVTNQIDGYLYLVSFDDLTKNQLYFEVDLNTLDTGIGLRNRHMRENYLETDKYQFTYFEGKIDSIKLLSENKYEVLVSGKMSIHGVTKDISLNGTIIKDEKNIQIESNFSVALSDYKIEIPKLMFMKIDENMKLVLDFHLTETKK